MSSPQLMLRIAPSRTSPGDWWSMAEVCQRLGLAGVEFVFELPFILPDRWSWEMLKRIALLAKEQSWFLSLHCPYTNIGALLPKRWRAAVDEHIEALEVAQALGVKTYTVHPGWVEEKYCTPELLHHCRERTSEALAALLAQSEGVTICIENQNQSEKEKMKAGVSPDNLHYLVRALSDVMFTFDLGHAYVFNGRPEEFAAILGSQRIGIAHIHDNSGMEDFHLPLGWGKVDGRVFLHPYRTECWGFPLFLETVGAKLSFVQVEIS